MHSLEAMKKIFNGAKRNSFFLNEDGFRALRMLESVCYRLEVIRYSLPLAPGLVGMIESLSYQPSKGLCAMLGLEQFDFYRAQRLRAVDKIFWS